MENDKQKTKADQIDGSQKIGKQFFDHSKTSFKRLQNNQKNQASEKSILKFMYLDS